MNILKYSLHVIVYLVHYPSTLPFCCLAICHICALCICGRTAEDINTITFAYDSLVSLPDRVKIWLTLVVPSAQILPQHYPPC